MFVSLASLPVVQDGVLPHKDDELWMQRTTCKNVCGVCNQQQYRVLPLLTYYRGNRRFIDALYIAKDLKKLHNIKRIWLSDVLTTWLHVRKREALICCNVEVHCTLSMVTKHLLINIISSSTANVSTVL